MCLWGCAVHSSVRGWCHLPGVVRTEEDLTLDEGSGTTESFAEGRGQEWRFTVVPNYPWLVGLFGSVWFHDRSFGNVSSVTKRSSEGPASGRHL